MKTSKNRQGIKDLLKSGKAFSFIGEQICKAYESGGEHYVESIVSSDQEDLVGDIMTDNALEIMRKGFIGKTAFMNHRTDVPDDVFGSVLEAEFKKEAGMVLLWFKYIVEKENDAAMKTWRYIEGGRVQLGSSVTVLVKKSSPNPNRRKGLIIDDVEPIEVSIVGVPANRESLTLAASASKALNLSLLNSEDDMKQKGVDATGTTGETQEVATEVGATDGGLLTKARRGIERFKALIAKSQSLNAGEALELDEDVKVEKGMFKDLVEHPPFYELIEVLYDVYWTLLCAKYSLDYNSAGDNADYTDLLTSWGECLDEFKASCLDSFAFWYMPSESEDMTVSLSLADKFEETFTSLVTDINETSDEVSKSKLRETGIRLLSIAKSVGIELPTDEVIVAKDGDGPAEEATGDDAGEPAVAGAGDEPAAEAGENIEADGEVPEADGGGEEAEETPAEITEEDLEKNASYIAMRDRALTAEKKLGETEQELEVAKAGLGISLEALGQKMHTEPLHGARR